MLYLLAQLGGAEPGAEPLPPEMLSPEAISPWNYLWFWLLGWQGGLSSAFYLALLVWMIVYCVRNDPERWIWIWIMLLFQPFGAVIYFVVRWLPSSRWEAPGFLHRWTRRSRIQQLEVAAHQIGNAHQHVQLGDALREVGRWEPAGEAYKKALEKEPENLPALWGAANVHYKKSEYEFAREKLQRIIDEDPSYKFGDVSLLFGKSLEALEQLDLARSHFTEHVKKWRQPEGLFLLAKICAAQNDPAEARQHLTALIDDVNSSPKAIARKFLFWKGRAKRMLRRLPKT